MSKDIIDEIQTKVEDCLKDRKTIQILMDANNVMLDNYLELEKDRDKLQAKIDLNQVVALVDGLDEEVDKVFANNVRDRVYSMLMALGVTHSKPLALGIIAQGISYGMKGVGSGVGEESILLRLRTISDKVKEDCVGDFVIDFITKIVTDHQKDFII